MDGVASVSIAVQNQEGGNLYFDLRADDGLVIYDFMRKSDGYVNATAICQSVGREW